MKPGIAATTASRRCSTVALARAARNSTDRTHRRIRHHRRRHARARGGEAERFSPRPGADLPAYQLALAPRCITPARIARGDADLRSGRCGARGPAAAAAKAFPLSRSENWPLLRGTKNMGRSDDRQRQEAPRLVPAAGRQPPAQEPRRHRNRCPNSLDTRGFRAARRQQ